MCLHKSEIKRRLFESDSLYLLIPSALLLSALLIRIFSGEAVLMLSIIKDRGLFPGKFLYITGYIIRLILSGIITAYTLTDSCYFSSRLRLSSAVISLLLLTEYRLIFVSIRLFSAFIISCVSAFLSVYLWIKTGRRGKAAFALTVLMAILQVLFCIQLASLILNV